MATQGRGATGQQRIENTPLMRGRQGGDEWRAVRKIVARLGPAKRVGSSLQAIAGAIAQFLFSGIRLQFSSCSGLWIWATRS